MGSKTADTEGAPVPRALVSFIEEGGAFLIAGHEEPDGDCVGSELVLASLLRRRGKTAVLCSAGPFKRPEIRQYEALFTAAPGEAERRNARVILLDCSSLERTGSLASRLAGLPAAVIDHHAADGKESAAPDGPAFTDPSASSTTMLIHRLARTLNMALTPDEAQLLFLGLCTDTDFFRHVGSAGAAAGAAAFTAAAELTLAGADPRKIYQAINGGRSLGSRILLGRDLARCEALFGGRLLLTTEEYEETMKFGGQGRDTDSLYQLLQTVEGAEAVVIIRQETPERCAVGLRSRDAIDVAAIAASFGGGGHKNAAGLAVPGTIASLRPLVIAAFSKVFGE
jgi:phosphoesterase RecJ-like protein